MTANGSKLTLKELAKLSIVDLKRRYDAADICSSAYANPRTPMPEGVRKALAIAHGELLKRQVVIRTLRRQLSHANAMVDELKKSAALTHSVTPQEQK